MYMNYTCTYEYIHLSDIYSYITTYPDRVLTGFGSEALYPIILSAFLTVSPLTRP